MKISVIDNAFEIPNATVPPELRGQCFGCNLK